MKLTIFAVLFSLFLILCCNNSPESNSPPDPSVVLNLSISDTVVNTSIYNYAMTFKNPIYCPDRMGNAKSALSFSGNNYLSIAHDPNLDFSSKSFTISLWIKADSNQMNGAGVITKGLAEHEQFSIDLDNNRYRFWVRDTISKLFIVTSNKSSDNKWHKLTAIYNQIEDSIYLFHDTTCIGKSNAPHKLLTTQEPLSIGARQGTSGTYIYFFKGAVSEISIFDKLKE